MVEDPRIDPWQIDESEFYELESDAEQMKFLIRYAVLAPSGHNTQPWSFRIVRDGVEVYADYSRQLAAADPMHRELLISVGAAITNLRVAAAHFGYEATVLYNTNYEPQLPVALVAMRETSGPPRDLRRLFHAITERHTNRERFEPREIDDTAVKQLAEFVDDHCSFVRFIVPQSRERARELITRADRVVMKSADFRSELADWIRGNESRYSDGMCVDGLGVPDVFARATPWFLRWFDFGDYQASRDSERIEHAAALIAITSDDDPVSLTRAGESLELLLLTITHLGLNYSFLNAPVEVDTLRDELWAMIDSPAPPQLLLRVGYAKSGVKPQPRREVESLIV